MTPADLKRIVAAMDERPWYSAESRWQSDCVLTGAPDAGLEPMGRVLVQANPNFPYRANLDGITALANHADALVALAEAVRAVVTAKNPEQDLVAHRALIAAYERLEAVQP